MRITWCWRAVLTALLRRFTCGRSIPVNSFCSIADFTGLMKCRLTGEVFGRLTPAGQATQTDGLSYKNAATLHCRREQAPPRVPARVRLQHGFLAPAIRAGRYFARPFTEGVSAEH